MDHQPWSRVIFLFHSKLNVCSQGMYYNVFKGGCHICKIQTTLVK